MAENGHQESARSSVTISLNSKGEAQITVKAYGDALESGDEPRAGFKNARHRELIHMGEECISVLDEIKSAVRANGGKVAGDGS